MWLSGVNTLPREMLRRTGLDAAFETRHFARVEDAVEALQAGRR
jgi:hypothetical protein